MVFAWITRPEKVARCAGLQGGATAARDPAGSALPPDASGMIADEDAMVVGP
jgi:hypothetical protein